MQGKQGSNPEARQRTDLNSDSRLETVSAKLALAAPKPFSLNGLLPSGFLFSQTRLPRCYMKPEFLIRFP
ncbi:hypothetical protein GCM10011349_23480 [Novosphingobium indicum]|uniref:Uncharacterized protein n=1 Tax=Novosphingobium indicum TaxID=462949 RepID=A0ABQ2JLZ2_9SPHN|nr:hypothetical protein GCM10011349_23480 [Novosphingobium indicum]